MKEKCKVPACKTKTSKSCHLCGGPCCQRHSRGYLSDKPTCGRCWLLSKRS